MNPIDQGLTVPTPQNGTISSCPYFSGDPLFPTLPTGLSKASPVELDFNPLPPPLQELLRKQALSVIKQEIDSDTATVSFFETAESGLSPTMQSST